MITLDADTQASPRRGATPRRKAGARAEPPARRPGVATRGRRVTACCSRASRRRCRSAGTARSSSACSRVRAGSIPTPSPCPTSTRISSARAPTPARVSTTSTPSRRRSTGRIPDDTVLSHDLLEGIFARAGSGLRHRGRRGVSGPVRGRSRSPAPLGARRLAAPAVDPRSRADGGGREALGARRGARGRALEDDRQPAAELVGADRLRCCSPAVAAAACARSSVDGSHARRCSPHPRCCRCFAGLLPRRRGISKRSHLRAVGADLALSLWQIGLLVALLPQQAWLMIDAIARTLYRLVVRRRLLEWRTAAQAHLGTRLDLFGYYRWMDGGLVLALGAGVAVAGTVGAAPGIAAPFLALWLFAPAIARGRAVRRRRPARRPSRTPRHARSASWHAAPGASSNASSAPRITISRPTTSRKIPKPVVAHRTSPTNIGLYLLVGRERARLRLARRARHGRATGGDARDAGTPRAFPRSLLQLVRHARPAPARPALRLDRSTAAISPGT